jgi:serine/threonine protein kinase
MKSPFETSLRHRLSRISDEARDLLSRMLEVDPAVRLSATEALRHPWLNHESHTERHDVHLDEAHTKIRAKVDDKRKRGDGHKTGLLGFLFTARGNPNVTG